MTTHADRHELELLVAERLRFGSVVDGATLSPLLLEEAANLAYYVVELLEPAGVATILDGIHAADPDPHVPERT